MIRENPELFNAKCQEIEKKVLDTFTESDPVECVVVVLSQIIMYGIKSQSDPKAAFERFKDAFEILYKETVKEND